jgi:hypothetical protein
VGGLRHIKTGVANFVLTKLATPRVNKTVFLFIIFIKKSKPLVGIFSHQMYNQFLEN